MAAEIQPFYRELGHKVRELRSKKKMTQEALGQLLDPQVTRASIANIETGGQRVLSHTLVQLAYHLDVNVADLLPPMKSEATNYLEGANIRDELKQKLRMPAKQVEELLRKLKK
jgi:transcriptional regulator with XRE-family HTH domain